jgi:hypothetical protein
MLTSIVMFASFALLFQPRAFTNAPALIGEGSAAETTGASSNDSAQQAVATDPEAFEAARRLAEERARRR